MIKLVIFDLDGTLVNAFPAVCASLNYSLKQLGYPGADDIAIQRSVGWGERNLMAKFVKPEDVDKIIAIYRQHHKRSLKSGTKFMPGAKELLKVLKEKGYSLALATNRPRWSTAVILSHLKIKDYFSSIICGDMLIKQKPDKEILERILSKAGLNVEQAIFVGDMTVDVETGNAAKMKTIAIPTGSNTKEEVAQYKPFRIVENVFEAFEIVEGLNQA